MSVSARPSDMGLCRVVRVCYEPGTGTVSGYVAFALRHQFPGSLTCLLRSSILLLIPAIAFVALAMANNGERHEDARYLLMCKRSL